MNLKNTDFEVSKCKMGICWSFDCNACESNSDEFPPPMCVVKAERSCLNRIRQIMEPVNKTNLKKEDNRVSTDTKNG